MANFNYAIAVLANGDISIQRTDGLRPYVPWSDPDFQAWNAAQTTPFVLSNRQQFLQQVKGLTLAQLQSATQAQKDRLLYELLQKTLRDEIV